MMNDNHYDNKMRDATVNAAIINSGGCDYSMVMIQMIIITYMMIIITRPNITGKGGGDEVGMDETKWYSVGWSLLLKRRGSVSAYSDH